MADSLKKPGFDLNSPENRLIRALEVLIRKCKTECSKYHYLGPSEYDNHLGYTEFDLKKYRKILSARVRKFLKDNQKEINSLKLRVEITKRISEAKRFRGETVYELDPHAKPGRNHHTGKPYY